jgi:hypothetical protein
MVHLSEANADKWLPLLHQVGRAKSGVTRPREATISDSYKRSIGKLVQHQKRLTEGETAKLVADYRAGCTIMELAARLCCDRKTVIRYLKLSCVETRYRKLLGADQIEEAATLHTQGVSLAALGRKFGVDPKTIKARLAEYGDRLRE